mgnify:FL=1
MKWSWNGLERFGWPLFLFLTVFWSLTAANDTALNINGGVEVRLADIRPKTFVTGLENVDLVLEFKNSGGEPAGMNFTFPEVLGRKDDGSTVILHVPIRVGVTVPANSTQRETISLSSLFQFAAGTSNRFIAVEIEKSGPVPAARFPVQWEVEQSYERRDFSTEELSLRVETEKGVLYRIWHTALYYGAPASEVAINVYLSTDPFLNTSSDSLIYEGTIGGSGGSDGSPGRNGSGFPIMTPIGETGKGYYLISVLDPGNVWEETNEKNNVFVASVTIPPIEIFGMSLNAGSKPESFKRGEILRDKVTLYSLGLNETITVKPTLYLTKVYSPDGSLPSDAIKIKDFGTVNLAPNATFDLSFEYSIPANQEPGNYFILGRLSDDPQAPVGRTHWAAKSMWIVSGKEAFDVGLVWFDAEPRVLAPGEGLTKLHYLFSNQGTVKLVNTQVDLDFHVSDQKDFNQGEYFPVSLLKGHPVLDPGQTYHHSISGRHEWHPIDWNEVPGKHRFLHGKISTDGLFGSTLKDVHRANDRPAPLFLMGEPTNAEFQQLYNERIPQRDLSPLRLELEPLGGGAFIELNPLWETSGLYQLESSQDISLMPLDDRFQIQDKLVFGGFYGNKVLDLKPYFNGSSLQFTVHNLDTEDPAEIKIIPADFHGDLRRNTKESSGWKYHERLGFYLSKPEYGDWIFIPVLGWAAYTPKPDADVFGLWLYCQGMGWFYSDLSIFPYLYCFKIGGWSYLKRDIEKNEGWLYVFPGNKRGIGPGWISLSELRAL